MERAESQGSAPTEPKTSETAQAYQDVSDPDEDDLDDLDDMLDEFSAIKLHESNINPGIAAPGEFAATKLNDSKCKYKTVAPGDRQDLDVSGAAADDFSKQLREQMAALMGSVDESPEMRKEIEAMMKDLGAVAGPEILTAPQPQEKVVASEKAPVTGADEPFQESIRKTMERMQASGEQATAAAKSEDSDDMLGQMLKEMQNGSLDGAGDEEGFNKMLMGMMEQLTNKEILYEPMKELHDKFPDWMAKNRSRTDAENLKRYDEQQRLVGEIVGKFEMKGYSDDKAEDREFIVERMQLMQAAGSPPADLVGDVNAAQEAIGDIDTGCPQQ